MTSLEPYDDWPDWEPGPHRSDDPRADALARVLGVPARRGEVGVQVQDEQVRDGVLVRRLTWDTGVGPATTAWSAQPAGSDGDGLPGVLGLHVHGGTKSVGAATMVTGDAADHRVGELRQRFFEGRAPAEDLARAGAVVLVHDAFAWGSRRFTLGMAAADDAYDARSSAEESVLVRTASLLGTSLAGMVAHDDLVALDRLAGLPGVAGPLGVFGFSGGGSRAAFLAGLDPRVAAVVVTGALSRWRDMVPAHAGAHSWLLNSPGVPAVAELWEVATWSGTGALLAQWGLDDPLFPLTGMRAADAGLTALAAGTGLRYEGRFHPAGHVFGVAMQDEAWRFLVDALASRPA